MNEELAKQIEAMEARYRTLFASPNGSEVLADMLFKLRFFEKIEGVEGIAAHNFAIELLTMTKVILPDETGDHVANAAQLVRKLLTERTEP